MFEDEDLFDDDDFDLAQYVHDEDSDHPQEICDWEPDPDDIGF